MILLERCGIVNMPPLKGIAIQKPHKNEVNQDIKGTWRLSYDSDSVQVDSMNGVPRLESLISFYGDSSYSIVDNRGVFNSGNWSRNFKDSSITLHSAKNDTRFTPLFGREPTGLRLLNLVQANSDTVEYAGFGRALEVFQEDPYYPKNNEWRQKPKGPENKKQILERLRGNILHTALIFKAANTRNQQVISWEFSPGIVRIYSSGIGLTPADKIPKIWINYFDSPKDAMTAYLMLEEFLKTTTYKGDPTGNWVKDDYLILMSIYTKLEKHRFEDIL